eukprot:4277620-Lingulodinium_polyedra.AAC.1
MENQRRCLHPFEQRKRGGNQHATRTALGACKLRISYRAKPARKSAPQRAGRCRRTSRATRS